MGKIIMRGIDVSSHQGNVDFNKVKKAGYDFVIIKAGEWLHEMDTFKKRYLPAVLAAGLEWGAYWWSDAVTVEEAKQEARAFLKALDGLKPTFPIWMDQEFQSPCGRWGINNGKQLRTDMAKAFLDVLEQAGYFAGLYASQSWLDHWVDSSQLTRYDKWVAQYANKCTYNGQHGIWQHTVIGKKGTKGKDYWTFGFVPGLTENCDVNVCYKDYPTIIKANGKNGWALEPKPKNPEPEPEMVPKAKYDAVVAERDKLVKKVVQAVKILG